MHLVPRCRRVDRSRGLSRQTRGQLRDHFAKSRPRSPTSSTCSLGPKPCLDFKPFPFSLIWKKTPAITTVVFVQSLSPVLENRWWAKTSLAARSVIVDGAPVVRDVQCGCPAVVCHDRHHQTPAGARKGSRNGLRPPPSSNFNVGAWPGNARRRGKLIIGAPNLGCTIPVADFRRKLCADPGNSSTE